MKTFVSTYPTLGQVTVINQKLIFFSALLEIEDVSSGSEWQVSLWHSDREAKFWTEKPMHLLPNVSDQPIDFSRFRNLSGCKRLYFTTNLTLEFTFSFFIKFRKNTDHSWKCSRDFLHIPDGTVIINSKPFEKNVSNNLSQYIHGLDPNLEWKKCSETDSSILLWCIEGVIDAAEANISRVIDFQLGTPWGEGKILRWMAIVRESSPWLAPRQGTHQFDLDKEAIMCSFLNYHGKHLVLLALSGIENVITLLTSSDKGTVVLRVRNDEARIALFRVLVGIGDDFELIVTAVMDYARDFLTNLRGRDEVERGILKNKCKDKNVNYSGSGDWYDGLTFCTWNSLGQKLTADKVIAAATTLAKNKINVTNFVIDDNWQAIDYRGKNQYQHGWVEFEAERDAFPKGLKDTVECIRNQLPSVKNVAVWHAILGYWGGLAPDGKLARNYKTIDIERTDVKKDNLPINGKMTVVASEDVETFYNDFYEFLLSCGVNAVKTDVQSMLDTLVSAEDRRDLTTAYLEACISSTIRHFGVKAISCMSQTPQSLFHNHIFFQNPRYMVRNSDDFYPEILASHPWHIFSNAHNTLLMRHFNCLPDWDMFQTVHDYSRYHAAARCISGGPIYITDVPGQHDLDLIDQITSLTPKGKTIVLRPSIVGRSLDQYVRYDDSRQLLIGAHHKGVGIIGCFNISQNYCSEIIPLSKFFGITNGLQYVIHAYTTGAISKPMKSSDLDALFCVSLDARCFEIFTASPLIKFENKMGKDEILIANLGLLGKMTGTAAVVRNQILRLDNEIVLETHLKALGILGIYLSSLTNILLNEKIRVTISEKPVPAHNLRISKVDMHILEIDIATAWKELSITSGERDEVEIQVKIS